MFTVLLSEMRVLNDSALMNRLYIHVLCTQNLAHLIYNTKYTATLSQLFVHLCSAQPIGITAGTTPTWGK